ncbi:MAG: ABC transporter substrate-binding protein [Saprospiraceae bacterium]|nr:ABC transporter substrate-binding protein [Saprospiraceae bacterium]
MKTVKLALDWTPNINHIGFFVAQEKGFYQALDLQVQILDPFVDKYQTTPAKKVELGQADFALCPTESIISYRTKKEPFDLIAVAAILQNDLSAIVVEKNKGIHSPKDLDGKVYGSYNARYEEAIVMEMIRNDGGQGNMNVLHPEKLGIWNTLWNGNCDATWIFLNWEGIEAQKMPASFNYFKMADFGIPYSYSPVIAASEEKVSHKTDTYRAFMQATKKGYAFCQHQPDEAISILHKKRPENDAHIDLQQALAMSLQHFGGEKEWGMMEKKTIQKFVRWIKEKGLESTDISADDLYTNTCLID